MKDLEKYIKKIKGDDFLKNLTIKKLCGDASAREYYRVSSDSTGIESFIIMVLEKPVTDEKLPFINIHQFLQKNKIPVPKIFDYCKDDGILLLEDLSDLSMEIKLKKEPENKIIYYKKAIDILTNMQKANKGKSGCIAHSYKFTIEKFMEELDFFLSHTFLSLMNKKVNNLKTIRETFLKICKFATSSKYTFTHRDYHSRNIMIKDGNLNLIDFQDARLGPFTYDIASLLRDSYFPLDRNSKDLLLDYYYDNLGNNIKVEKDHFVKLFDYMSIQRNFKAIGTFTFQKAVKKNDQYMQYIPYAIDYIDENILKYPELGNLKVLTEMIRFCCDFGIV